MKKYFVLFVAVLALSSCVYRVKYTNNETMKSRTEQVSSFERIEVNGSPTVYYVQGDSVSVRAEGPEDALTRLRLTSRKGLLVIEPRDKLIDFGSDGISNVTVYVSSPDLIGVSLRGSGDFKCEQPLDTDTLTLSLVGSGDIQFRSLVCDYVQAELVGSGDINLNQTETKWARFSLVGSGDIKAHFDRCRQASCELRGSGDMELSGTVNRLEQQVSGSGDINTSKLQISEQE